MTNKKSLELYLDEAISIFEREAGESISYSSDDPTSLAMGASHRAIVKVLNSFKNAIVNED